MEENQLLRQKRNVRNFENVNDLIKNEKLQKEQIKKFQQVGKLYLETIVKHLILFVLNPQVVQTIEQIQFDNLIEFVSENFNLKNPKQMYLLMGVLYHKNQTKEIQAIKSEISSLIEFMLGIKSEKQNNLQNSSLTQVIFLKTISEIHQNGVQKSPQFERNNSNNMILQSNISNRQSTKSSEKIKQESEIKINKSSFIRLLDDSQLQSSFHFKSLSEANNYSNAEFVQRSKHKKEVTDFLRQKHPATVMNNFQKYVPQTFFYKKNEFTKTGSTVYQQVTLNFTNFLNNNQNIEYKAVGKGSKNKDAQADACYQVLYKIFMQHPFIFKQYMHLKGRKLT